MLKDGSDDDSERNSMKEQDDVWNPKNKNVEFGIYIYAFKVTLIDKNLIKPHHRYNTSN